MVTIVAPKNLMHNVINVALNLKQLISENKNGRIKLLTSKEVNNFWNNLYHYVDKSDKSLIILDVPHPEAQDIEKIKLEPLKAIILYLTSELNPLTKEEREHFLNKGISIIPERKPYECFIGDITQENKEWVNSAKILALEEKKENVSTKEHAVAQGIIEATLTSPHETIKKILKNDFQYFYDQGKKQRFDAVVKTKRGDSYIEVKGQYSPSAMSTVWGYYTKNRPEPLVVDGGFKVIATRNPSFFRYITQDSTDIKHSLDFGRTVFFLFDQNIDSRDLIGIASKGSCSQYIVKIGEPKFMNLKTLERHLVGGSTSETRDGKTYEKRYRGLVDQFPDIKFIATDFIAVPEGALEDVIHLLHESGTSYELTACSPKPISR